MDDSPTPPGRSPNNLHSGKVPQSSDPRRNPKEDRRDVLNDKSSATNVARGDLPLDGTTSVILRSIRSTISNSESNWTCFAWKFCSDGNRKHFGSRAYTPSKTGEHGRGTVADTGTFQPYMALYPGHPDHGYIRPFSSTSRGNDAQDAPLQYHSSSHFGLPTYTPQPTAFQNPPPSQGAPAGPNSTPRSSATRKSFIKPRKKNVPSSQRCTVCNLACANGTHIQHMATHIAPGGMPSRHSSSF